MHRSTSSSRPPTPYLRALARVACCLLLALAGFVVASCADPVSVTARRPRADLTGCDPTLGACLPSAGPCTATSDDCICDDQGNCCRRDAWCHVGGDTVIVIPLPDSLLLTADSTLVSPGAPVTFTARAASGLPISTQSWYWVPTYPAPGVTVTPHPECAGQVTCTAAVADSGRMLVNAYVAAHPGLAQASAAVAVTASVVLDVVDLDSTRVVSGGVPALHPFIGRPVRLRARAHDSATYAVSAAVWTPPGGTAMIKNYDLATGRLDRLQPADLSTARLQFYFTASGVVQVPVQATLTNRQNGRSFSKTATAVYFPAGPTNVSMVDTTTRCGVRVGVYQPGTIGLSLGQDFNGSTCGRGILFRFAATAPAGDGNGYVAATQLTSSVDNVTPTPGVTPTITAVDTHGECYLDACPLYGPARRKVGSTYTWKDRDTPGTPLDTTMTAYSRADQFITYFMYRPGGAGSIWVPIGKLAWNWAGTATRTGPDTVKMGWRKAAGDKYTANPSGAPTSDFPTWTHTFPNGGCDPVPTP